MLRLRINKAEDKRLKMKDGMKERHKRRLRVCILKLVNVVCKVNLGSIVSDLITVVYLN